MNTCYICDEKVGNDKVHLATGIAPHSKLGLPAKISSLIGDDFVVVVTQADNVCRRCSALINHMDKLETELTYVKKAITGYIRVKYNLPLDDDSKNAVVNGDTSPAKKAKKTSLPTPQFKSQTPVQTPTSIAPKPTPAPATPQADESPKLKIYKCGFCAFQSKDLNSVRLHMRVHIKAKPEEAKKTTPAAVAAPPPAPVTPTQQPSSPLVRKKLFRCQVCSASFVDRKSCLQHIKLTHSKASTQQSNKENEEAAAPAQTSEPMETQPSAQGVNEPPAQVPTEQAPEEPMDTTTNDVPPQEETPQTESTETTQKESEVPEPSTEETQESTENTTEPTEDETKIQQPSGEQKEDLDIEAMLAALHSEGGSTNSESMAINL